MTRFFILCATVALVTAQVPPSDTADLTNDFYDNAETFLLPCRPLTVTGEAVNPGPVDYVPLPVRSVIVKETSDTGFAGAYRYDGYSLYDILNSRILAKKNASEFPPIIDAYVVVTGASGERTCFSWGEIYYPVHRHEILVAVQVMRIVPSKTKELWPVPAVARIVAATDLVTARNLSDPVEISVRSFAHSYTVNRTLKPLYSPGMTVVINDRVSLRITRLPRNLQQFRYATVFYGRGTGIHGVTDFTGVPLRRLLESRVPVDSRAIREGLFCIAAADGYRGVFTLSELYNRNDQAETLVVPHRAGEDGGLFSLFPAGDFFSDRAIKSVSEIRYITVQ